MGAGDKFKVVGRNGEGALYSSGDIEFSKVKSVGESTYQAAQGQITEISGITAADDKTYLLEIFVGDDSKTFGVAAPTLFVSYHSATGDTDAEISAGLAAALNKQMAKMQFPILSADGTTTPGTLVITSIPQKDGFIPGVVKFTVPYFAVSCSGALRGATADTTQGASKGSGEYETVAYEEWFLDGNSGEPWRVGNYPKDKILLADPAIDYDTLTVSYVDAAATTLDRSAESFGTLMFESTSTAHGILSTIFGI